MFSGIGGLCAAVESAMDADVSWQLDLINAEVRRRHWPDALQVEQDVQTVDPASLPAVDILYDGFPCQDLSVAGSHAGLAGRRSGLHGELVRFATVLEPTYVVMENVPGLRRHADALDEHWGSLGYRLTWVSCRASDVGAPHRRSRVFVVGVREGRGERVVLNVPSVTPRGRPWPTPTTRDYKSGSSLNRVGTEPLSSAVGARRMGAWGQRLNPEWVEAMMGYPVGWTAPAGPSLRIVDSPRWPAFMYSEDWDRTQEWPQDAWEPRRTFPDGPPIPGRASRVRALGNAVCPQQGGLAIRHALGRYDVDLAW